MPSRVSTRRDVDEAPPVVTPAVAPSAVVLLLRGVGTGWGLGTGEEGSMTLTFFDVSPSYSRSCATSNRVVTRDLNESTVYISLAVETHMGMIGFIVSRQRA